MENISRGSWRSCTPLPNQTRILVVIEHFLAISNYHLEKANVLFEIAKYRSLRILSKTFC